MARRRPKNARDGYAPRASFEELEIHTSDGVALRAVVDDPPEGLPLLGTCVLAHAMFARKSEFGRRDAPGLSRAIARAGFRTIAFDFRGHGDSKVPGEWGYDDLVRLDLPAVISSAQARGEGKPVVVLGHSLGGHVALAAQGTGAIAVDGIVAVASNVWLRELEPSSVRWAAKLAVARAAMAAVARVGTVPARRLRIGSDDESARYMRDLLRVPLEGRWASDDGVDYLASLANVTVPVAAVVSRTERLNCHHESGARFAQRCAGPVEVTRVSGVGHMELVTTPVAHGALLAALDWAAGFGR
ncbi:MAG: alpha/beta fold hydrolase [Deltaproteobacteria bacterium]|nr:alpha/beta fold hydrolase [Deltaproteobacteria bacterium]